MIGICSIESFNDVYYEREDPEIIYCVDIQDAAPASAATWITIQALR